MSILPQIRDFCLDFLFPPRCVSCDQKGGFLCESCFRKIDFNIGMADKPFSDNKLDRLVSATHYHHNPVLQRAILSYKYKFLKNTAPIFAKQMAKGLSEFRFKDYVLVPVPLHWRRRFWRGFNQAEELAKVISEENKVEVSNLLKRVRYTPPQAQMKKKERQKNVKNAFELIKNIPDKKIVLVDDVAGSGATLGECVKVLKKAGAKEVDAVVIAWGDI